MIMLPIIIVSTNKKTILNGTHVHMYEIALYLQDKGLDVYFLSTTHNEDMINNYEERYTKTIPIYTIDTLPQLHTYNIFCYRYYMNDNINRLYTNATSISYLITDGLKNNEIDIQNYSLSLMRKLYNNTTFLYDPLLPTETQYPNLYTNKVECSWGITNHLKIEDTHSDTYFIYARHNDTRIPGISTYSNTDKVNEAIDYCNKNDIQYVLDTKKCFDPWNKYKGLIYTRNIDYSPRLPFEFGKANKPTLCFDTSPGLRTLAEDYTLYKPIIMQTKKKLYIPLDIFK